MTVDEFNAAFVSTSDKCRIACGFCFRADRGLHDLDPSTLAWTASRLSEIGVRAFCFTGGEPTDHPNLRRLLMLSSRFGIASSVTTAARPAFPLSTLTKCAPLLQHITVSAESHGARLFGRSVRAFEDAVRIYDRMNDLTSVSVHLTFYALSLNEVLQLAEFARRSKGGLDLSFLAASKEMLIHKGVSPRSYLLQLARDFKLLSGSFQIEERFANSFELFARMISDSVGVHRPCESQRLYVSADGYIRRCPYIKDGQVSVTSARERIHQAIDGFIASPPETSPYCAAFCQSAPSLI